MAELYSNSASGDPFLDPQQPLAIAATRGGGEGAGVVHDAAEQSVQVQGFGNAEADLAHAGEAISNASTTTAVFGSVSQLGAYRGFA